MGQKEHPTLFRLGTVFKEESTWYGNKFNYPDLLIEDYEIRNHIKAKLYRAGISKILISRRAQQVEINIHTARPGVVIGKNGDDAEKLKSEMAAMLKKKVVLNIHEVSKVDMDAVLLAESIANQLAKRISFKRAMKQGITRVLKAGALGVKIRCSGRLGGAEIARSEWYREGRVPLHTIRANIDYAFSEALTTYGKIGIKVWIYKGDVLGVDRQQTA